MARFANIGIGVLAFMGVNIECQAGAWTLPKGKGLVISGTSYNSANLAYNAERKRLTPVSFNKIDSTFYLEYGLGRNLTLVGNSALQDVSYTSSQGPQNYSGFSTSKFGLRYGVSTDSPWVVAIQPSLVIPAGGETVPDGDLGLGGYGGEFRILAGRALTFAGQAGFFNAEAAYDLRSDGAPRQITTDLTLGFDLTEKMTFIGQGFYRHTNDSMFEGDTVLANESLKLQASLVFDLPKFSIFKSIKSGSPTDLDEEDEVEMPTLPKRKTSLQIGVFQTVAGKNIVREQGGLITLWNEF